MTAPKVEDLAGVIQRWRSFQECLLHDMRLTKFGFGLDLTFNYVWAGAADYQVRADSLEKPRLITLRLLGVESLRLTGGLTRAMVDDPDRINWGLSEIARVEPLAVTKGLGLSVRWEGARRLDVEFWGFEVLEPE